MVSVNGIDARWLGRLLGFRMLALSPKNPSRRRSYPQAVAQLPRRERGLPQNGQDVREGCPKTGRT